VRRSRGPEVRALVAATAAAAQAIARWSSRSGFGGMTARGRDSHDQVSGADGFEHGGRDREQHGIPAATRPTLGVERDRQQPHAIGGACNSPYVRIGTTGRIVRLAPGVTTVGRGQHTDVSSRRSHRLGAACHYRALGPYALVSDLGTSVNGTLVNGRPVGRPASRGRRRDQLWRCAVRSIRDREGRNWAGGATSSEVYRS